jgi:hypothetical protein
MRGAGGSYGITTSYTMKTYPVPPSVTYFLYQFPDLTVAEATRGISAYQSFVLSDIPAHLGINFVISQADERGRVNTFVTGGWYADNANFNATIQSLLGGFPKPTSTVVKVASYIEVMNIMGQFTGSPSLTNTTVNPYRFYVKSLMTPADSPMTEEAIKALVEFFATEAVDFQLVNLSRG